MCSILDHESGVWVAENGTVMERPCMARRWKDRAWDSARRTMRLTARLRDPESEILQHVTLYTEDT